MIGLSMLPISLLWFCESMIEGVDREKESVT